MTIRKISLNEFIILKKLQAKLGNMTIGHAWEAASTTQKMKKSLTDNFIFCAV